MAIYEKLYMQEQRQKLNLDSVQPCRYCYEQDKLDVESVGYCRDCMHHLCAPCLIEHDEAFYRKPHYLILHYTCKDEKVLSLFCKEHKKLCKERCGKVTKNFDHTIEKLVNSFENAFQKGDEVRSITKNVKRLLDQVERISKSRLTPQHVDRQQEIINLSFFSMRSEMNTYFDELEQMADGCMKEAIENKEKHDCQKFKDTDIAALEDSITDTTCIECLKEKLAELEATM